MEAIAPGSIKAKVLEAITELGHAATSAAIRRRHPSNEHLVNLSIDQLTAAGLVEVTSEGNYALTAAAKKGMRGQSIESAAAAIASQRRAPAEVRPEPPAPTPIRRPVPPPVRVDAKLSAPEVAVDESRAATCEPERSSISDQFANLRMSASQPASPPSITTQEPAVAKIKCNRCEDPKAEGEFYTCKGKLVQPCKQCVLARQKELRQGTGKPAKRGKRAKVMQRAAKSVIATATSDDFVIPASGAIHCQRAGDGFAISQGEDRICVTGDQLQALRDWASAQLKARS
jgi:hypothetical protein